MDRKTRRKVTKDLSSSILSVGNTTTLPLKTITWKKVFLKEYNILSRPTNRQRRILIYWHIKLKSYLLDKYFIYRSDNNASFSSCIYKSYGCYVERLNEKWETAVFNDLIFQTIFGRLFQYLSLNGLCVSELSTRLSKINEYPTQV